MFNLNTIEEIFFTDFLNQNFLRYLYFRFMVFIYIDDRKDRENLKMLIIYF
jgi:hypothetical protein